MQSVIRPKHIGHGREHALVMVEMQPDKNTRKQGIRLNHQSARRTDYLKKELRCNLKGTQKHFGRTPGEN